MKFIAALKLRFDDENLERRFSEHYNRTYIVQARLALALGIFLVGLDALVDSLADPSIFYLGNKIRLFVVVPVLGIGIVVLFSRFSRQNFQISLLVWGVTAGLALLSAMSALEVEGGQGLSSWVGLLNFTFVMIFAFVLMGLQFRNSCLIGFIFFVAYVCLLAVYTPVGAVGIGYQFYHLLTLVALIVFLSYARERFIRRDFVGQVSLAEERERSERLLYNTLPPLIAERMKSGERPIADALPEVAVLFADVVGFTPLAARVGPEALVQFLNSLFSEFDRLSEKHGLEKIKTIGDAYMVIGRKTEQGTGTARQQTLFASYLGLAMIEAAHELANKEGQRIDVRVGIHTGPVVAGVIGETRFQYDVWGDTVNIASRLETTCVPGRVQVSEAVRKRIAGEIETEPQGSVELKGHGTMQTFLLKRS